MSFYNNKFEDIIVLKKDHTLWLSLNRPNHANAISTQMILSLTSVLEYADFDEDIRVIVLTGAGKHFCAGGDVRAMKEKKGMFKGESNELRKRYEFGIQKIPRAIEALQTPIIAMINGAAIGAGLDLACMCDIRIASDQAKFGETFVKLGLIPGDGGTFFLQRVIGYAKAMELSLTGEVFDAKKALEIRLLNEVTSSDQLDEKVEELSMRIAKNAPIAVSMVKKAIKHSYENSLNSSLDLLSSYQGITQRTSDHFKGLDALEQKTKADFSHD